MNKKIISIVISSIATISTISAATSISNFSAVVNGEVNGENTIWGHYDALTPMYKKPGSREFWISCDDHTIVYEAPTVGKIEERGTPSVTTIKSWGSEDNRYIPQYYIDKNTMWYGYYPQSLVKDETTINALNAITTVDSRGYKTLNNNKYFEYSGVEYTDDDGTTITAGNHYYEVERIEWKILSSSSSSVFVASSNLLTPQCYYSSDYSGTKTRTDYQGNSAEVYANNYKYSDLRTFLNTTFLSQAFDDASKILTTEVDNSAASTKADPNPYACENTSDKVFAISASEMKSGDKYSDIKTSEYARAKGAYYLKKSYVGRYWTRSPSATTSAACRNALYVYTGASTPAYNVSYTTNCCARPAMNFSIA